MNDINEFDWQRYPEAGKWVSEQLEHYSRSNPGIANLETELLEKVGARLIDFTDYLVVDSKDMVQQLEEFGYIQKDGVWIHPGAALPRIVSGRKKGIAVKVDSIAQFLAVRGLSLPIDGSLYTRFRRCEISTVNDVTLWVVERRFSDTVEPVPENPGYLDMYFETLERWRTRPRHFEDEKTAAVHALELADRLVKTAGTDLAAYLFIEAEQEFWVSKHRAARVHKNHADLAGVGWANRDHHTYRNTRETFSPALTFFLTLGFKFRERFYAGEEAGWGAQVMENPGIDVSLFLDVDLAPEELDINFLNEDLPESSGLGTAGLWTYVHGGALGGAGMHHVAVRSHFERLPEAFAKENVKMMKPFSNFSYLKQAFTRPDFWPVKQERVRKLLNDGIVDEETAERFLTKGVVGSHVENIQREDGFKGFNQERISDIIAETYPGRYKG